MLFGFIISCFEIGFDSCDEFAIVEVSTFEYEVEVIFEFILIDGLARYFLADDFRKSLVVVSKDEWVKWFISGGLTADFGITFFCQFQFKYCLGFVGEFSSEMATGVGIGFVKMEDVSDVDTTEEDIFDPLDGKGCFVWVVDVGLTVTYAVDDDEVWFFRPHSHCCFDKLLALSVSSAAQGEHVYIFADDALYFFPQKVDVPAALLGVK